MVKQRMFKNFQDAGEAQFLAVYGQQLIAREFAAWASAKLWRFIARFRKCPTFINPWL